MNLQKSALELKQQIEVLNSLAKEEVTFMIKGCIYELENLKLLSEEGLSQLNKVILSNEPFNNLYFKYNKERLNIRGIIYLEEADDLQFMTSVFLYFKMRTPLMVNPTSDLQKQFFHIFIKVLKDNNTSDSFIVNLDA
ncbi:hypothetical protein N9325_00950 [Alphaproteobacteria bacterium]|jgi:hypothetical protein|nr:hypothetical protein [Alphaproteobacteria bacterium]MDC0594255.1 hypothetical protein [Alphaproteobacteria bacterium]|tara:strand:+ start:1955 stop:2368 length:414 start_codon:yes stop_codon:yes gene_type:complete